MAACVLVVATAVAHAERLPVRVFTTADGLANNGVERGAEDTRGFLWFATSEGVSRYDGRSFETFGTADGLPSAVANDIAAAPDGKVWVATDGGLAVFDPDEVTVRPRFRALTHDSASAVLVAPDGVIWAGTYRGVVRVERGVTSEQAVLEPATSSSGARIPTGVISLAYDPHDRTLWLGTFQGLVHLGDRGVLGHYQVGPRELGDDRIFAVLVARDGTLWINHATNRVLAVKPPLAPAASLWEAPGGLHLETDGFARRHLLEDSRGTIWIGTSKHLHRWRDGRLERLSAQQIGTEGSPGPSLEDSAGNLWFGTDTHGVVRLARGGLVSYDTDDGLRSLFVYDFVRDGDALYPVALDDGHWVHRRVGDRFEAIQPARPPASTVWGWGYGQKVVLARDGRWWFPTGDGIARYPAARLDTLATATGERLTVPTGIDILHLYEDRRGDVWISTMSKFGLARWDHERDTIVALRDGWPKGFPGAYAEDRHGDVWIGFTGELARVRGGVPEVRAAPVRGAIDALLFDHAGRLWVASATDGLARIDDPDHPVAVHYGAAELGSDQALSLVEDEFGRIYVGTSRGIARIDPTRGEVTHYGLADGLRNDFVVRAARDAAGVLWFGSKGGLARLVPEPPRSAGTPRVFVMSVRVASAPVPLASGGTDRVAAPALPYDDAAIDVEVASPQLAIDGAVRFQYRLGGGWSEPIAERVLHFAGLSPGAYELEVRAVNAAGAVSPSATVTFRVLSPIWRRWWFLAASALGLGLAAYAWYRRRLAHALALERVRRRIATDLHDELGANLSRIAILSEVAARRTAHADPQLETIGTTARALVDVASDIVWSTDPRRDDLRSVIVRLRSFAADVFETRGVAWSVTAPAEPERVKLDPERRRHVYLVLKEAMTNAAKHSGATRVDVAIRFEGDRLVATVRDDGCGFDPDTLGDTGNGLANMRARAAEAGGTLEVRHGDGTEVVLTI